MTRFRRVKCRVDLCRRNSWLPRPQRRSAPWLPALPF
jgi:hypothetical protein